MSDNTQSTSQLVTAFAKALSEFKPLKKTARNPHFSSNFCPLDEVISALTPVLIRNGLVYRQRVSGFCLETSLHHVSGESMQMSSYPLGDGIKYVRSKDGSPGRGEYDPQLLGSCITYARRYAMTTDLGVAADDDDDGNSASGKATRQSGQSTGTSTGKSMF